MRTESSKGGRVRWTPEMCTTLMLLRTQTAYRDNNDQVAAIFNHVYANTLLESGYKNGMPSKKILDTWNGRKLSGRGSLWRDLDNKPDAQQIQYRKLLLQKIKGVAAELGRKGGEDNAGAAEDEDGSELGDGAGDIEGASESRDSDPPSQPVKLDTNMATTSPVNDSVDGANEQTPDQSTKYIRLGMIHASKATTWKQDVPHSSADAFIDQDQPICGLGGRVYRAIIDGKEQDVMICNRNVCRQCKKKIIDKTLLAKSASKTEDLPFVHAADLQVVTQVGFKFRQDPEIYNNDYPERMWKTRVTFSHGAEREVMVCVAANCEHCSGKEMVDKRAARHLPGGDLYKLRLAIERASGRGSEDTEEWQSSEGERSEGDI